MHHLRYGTSMQYHFYTPEYEGKIFGTDGGHIVRNDIRKKSNRLESFESAVYAEDEMILTDWFTANIGLRYSAAITDGKNYLYI